MRKTLLTIALCAVGISGLIPAPAESGSSLPHEVAVALRAAHHAQVTASRATRTANAALLAARRLPVSVKGDAGANGTDGLNGAPGAVGQAGAAGTGGANGTTGPAGPKGDTGAAGAKGATGSQGVKGDTGPQGPAGAGGVKAYGHVTASGTGITTQGTTVTHLGTGLYCMTDNGFVAVVGTPDSWSSTVFALPPGDPHGSCGASWTVVVSNNSGADTGFYFVAN